MEMRRVDSAVVWMCGELSDVVEDAMSSIQYFKSGVK